MTGTPTKARGRTNPFYVLVLLTGTAFALTAWVGYVGPLLVRGPARDPGAGSTTLADWFDRRGNQALAVELALMIASGLLAMATDRWFSSGPARRGMADRPSPHD